MFGSNHKFVTGRGVQYYPPVTRHMSQRNYCWTLNNYTEDDYLHIISLEVISSTNYHIVAKEVGESGTPHLQGYTVFKKTLRFAALKKLFKAPSLHIEARQGSHQEAANYCKKTKEFVEFGEVKEIGKKKSAYSGIADCTSYEEACALVENEAPRDWYIQGDKIRENLKRKFIPAYPEYVPIFDVEAFYPPQELLDWVDSWTATRTPCLFLIGPTRLGKTAWARSIVDVHTYWKSMVNLDEFNPDSKLLIFDDFDWKFMPNPKGWLTQAGQCTVTDKYRHKKTITISMPAIFIANDLPEWSLSENTYWRANSKIINIFAALY